MIDYAENLCEAMKIIFEKQIKQLSFDITIDATVVDATNAKNGMYVVSHDGATFTAYSTDISFKEKDVVMVTVPQGNYDNQKMIIGKQVDKDKEEKPITYQSPFSQITNLSGNLIYGNIEEKGLLANGGIGKSGNEQTAAQIIFIKELKSSDNTLSEEYQSNGYTRIGLRADFSTWLNEFNIVSGNYGLILTLKFKNPDITDPEENSTITAIYTFDSSEFFGDIYNFETYYNQEAIFDISDYSNYPIQSITLEAYQKDNFKVSNGSDLSYENEFFDNSFKPSDNIFIKDPFICLGTAIGEFKKDSIKIVTDSSSTYTNAENVKNLKLKWTHQDLNSKDIYIVQENKIPANYEIRWYKFELGKPSPDEFMDAHWARFYGQNKTKNNDIVTNKINISFSPDPTNQTEQIRAIVLKIDNNNTALVARSPIITFNNDNEVPNKANKIDANALGIQFTDSENGNYYYYDKTGKIIQKEKSQTIRILKTVFDNNINLENKKDLTLQPYTSIKWIFPKTNTMIIPLDPKGKNILASSSEENENENNISSIYTVTTTDKNYEISFTNNTGDINKSILEQMKYRIDEYYSFDKSRNTIYLEVTINGQTYVSSVTMFFGMAGTSGSDYTIVVEWSEGIPVFDINGGEDYSLDGNVKLLDLNGEPITLNNSAEYTYNLEKTSEETEVEGYTELKVNKINNSNSEFNIVKDNNNYRINMNDLYLLEVKLTGFGDYDLITKYPIALKNNSDSIQINGITGTTTVRYASDGTITLDDKNPYSISFQEEKDGNYEEAEDKEVGRWTIHTNNEVNHNFLPELIEIDEENIIIEEFILELSKKNFGENNNSLLSILLKIISPAEDNNSIQSSINTLIDNINDTDFNFNDILEQEEQIDESDFKNYLEAINKNLLKKLFLALENRFSNFSTLNFQKINPILSPPSVYFKNIPLYGVQYILNNDATILYTQPIYVYQDNYPSGTLNKWNGKDLILDENNGTIIANGFSAGKKEDDNTFTGVMIGNWSRTEAEDDSITTNTGIYGFHQGAMSYAFKDDGTAFIGKDGQGRIEFDGNKGIIESANFNFDNQVGSQFDLQQGSIFLFGNQIAATNTYSLILNTDINNKLPFFRVGRQRNLQYISENIAQSFIDEYNQAVDGFIEVYNQQKDIIKLADTFLNGNTNLNSGATTDYSIFGDFVTWYKNKYPDKLSSETVKTSELFSIDLTPWTKDSNNYITNSTFSIQQPINSIDKEWLSWDTPKTIIKEYILYLYDILKSNNSGVENIKNLYNLENNDFDSNNQIKYTYLDLSQSVNESETSPKKYYFRYKYKAGENEPYYYIPIRPNRTTSIIFSHKITYINSTAIVKGKNVYRINESARFITPFEYQYNIYFDTTNGGKITYEVPLERLGLYKIFDYLINKYNLNYNYMNNRLENSLNNISTALDKIRNNLKETTDINYSNCIETFEFYKNGDEENVFNLPLFKNLSVINNVKENINTEPDNVYNLSQAMWSNHLIELTKDGGYITSKDYRPTITIDDLSRGYIRLPTQDQGVTNLSQDSSGMKGFIIDLTNNRIILGNNSAIIGYQTQRITNIDTTSQFRKFTISTGANFQGYDAFGRDILTSSSKDDSAYFIKATNGATEIFSIKWNGYVLCESLKVHNNFYFGADSNRVQSNKIAGVYDPQGNGNNILRFCDSNGNELSNIHVLCY